MLPRPRLSALVLLLGLVPSVALAAAPTVSSFSGTVAEDGSVNLTLRGSDPERDSLTFTVVTGPAHGSVTVAGSVATYRPTTNYNGADSFTYRATDSTGLTSGTATVNVSVTAVNDAPTAGALAVVGNEDASISATLPGSDVDSGSLTWSIITAPTQGSVSVDAATGAAVYTPPANWNGTTTFRYQVSDGTAAAAANVGVTVNPVNDPPVAVAGTAAVNEDGSVTVALSATDVDSTSLTYTVAAPPAHGSAAIVGRNLTYAPAPDYFGADTLTFAVSDGSATSAPASLTLTVNPVNDPPEAWSSAAMTDGRTVSLKAMASDIDSELTPVVTAGPDHGTASVVDGRIAYTPDAGYIGVDHLTWAVDDGTTTASAIITVSSLGTAVGAHAQWAQVGINSIPFYADAGVGSDSASTLFEPAYILADLDDLGIETYRQLRNADLSWSDVEPSEGNWALDDSDELLGMDEIEPRFSLFYTAFGSPTPPWATDPSEFQKGMTPAAYAYLDAVVGPYAGQGRYWEVANEMFHWYALDSDDDPATIENMPASYPVDGYTPEEQALFLRDASLYVKSIDPTAIIVLSAILPGAPATDDWIERVVATAGSDWFDVVTYHAYDDWKTTRRALPLFQAEMESLGLQDKLVQRTETGTTCYPEQTAKTNYPNSETTQAADVFRMLIPGFAAGESQIDWHTYRELVPYDLTVQGGLGLYAYDTTPRPAAFTMQLLTSELLPLVQVSDLSDLGAAVAHFETESLDGSVHHVYWGEGTATVPAGVTEMTSVVYDGSGPVPWTAVTPGQTVALSEVPVLMR